MLIWPIFLVIIGLAIAGWLSGSVAHGNNIAIIIIWVLYGILLLWAGFKMWEWSVYHFAITSQRLLLIQGVTIRQVNMMPLAKVTDMSFQRSPWGRLLGYGEFVVESAGQDQAMRNVRFLPHPEQLYLEVCALIFNEDERALRQQLMPQGAAGPPARRSPQAVTTTARAHAADVLTFPGRRYAGIITPHRAMTGWLASGQCRD